MNDYPDRYAKITAFSLDPVIDEMDVKYDPYLEMHGIDSIFYLFKIESLDPEADILSYKFSWNTDYEPPIELKRDIIALYNKHFESQINE